SFDAPLRGESLWKGTKLTPMGERASNVMAEKIVDEVKQLRQRAKEALDTPEDQRNIDQRTAVKMDAQKDWYNQMRTLLRKTFGSAGDLFADLLGATSARTPVETNLNQSLEAVERFTKGDYDNTLPQYRDYREAGGKGRPQREDHGPIHVRPEGVRQGGRKAGHEAARAASLRVVRGKGSLDAQGLDVQNRRGRRHGRVAPAAGSHAHRGCYCAAGR